jgi:hypothetical protein
MEHGAVVITNLDEQSPAYLRHMDTVIDIANCEALPSDSLTRRRMSVRAMEASQGLGWEHFMQAVARDAGSEV